MIKSILKNNNIKATKQRILLLNYIYTKNNFNIKEIINNFNDFDKSTIYRILKLFENKKIINKVVNNNEIYYHLTLSEHKHYIECVNCHNKEEIDVCPYRDIDLKGYIINQNEPIKGICLKCQNEEKIGIFVGSFNPPTKAHLEIGESLLKNDIIDKLVFVPCDNLYKDDLININYRYEMLNELISSKMIVDNLKVNSSIKSFNYQDLDILKNKYNGNIYVIMGADLLLKLDSFDNYLYLLNNYHFIIIKRDDINILDVINNKYLKYKDKFSIIEYHNNLSSTLIREMIKDNKDLSNVLDNKTIDYINRNHLYK